MKITQGVEMLEISADIMGEPHTIHPTLIWDDDAVMLVDAGFPGQLALLRQEMERVGIDMTKLNRVIITHHDIDHIGSLADILRERPDVEVITHEREQPYVQGEKRALKLVQLESRLEVLPENMRVMYEKFKAFYQKGTVPVSTTVVDGEKLPYCGGITVIYSPGHTLGHICLYLNQSKTLIVGDALKVEDGVLIRTPDSSNFDSKQYLESLKKLSAYDVENVICYHGGLFNNNANKHIAELAGKE